MQLHLVSIAQVITTVYTNSAFNRCIVSQLYGSSCDYLYAISAATVEMSRGYYLPREHAVDRSQDLREGMLVDLEWRGLGCVYSLGSSATDSAHPI